MAFARTIYAACMYKWQKLENITLVGKSLEINEEKQHISGLEIGLISEESSKRPDYFF